MSILHEIVAWLALFPSVGAVILLCRSPDQISLGRSSPWWVLLQTGLLVLYRLTGHRPGGSCREDRLR